MMREKSIACLACLVIFGSGVVYQSCRNTNNDDDKRAPDTGTVEVAMSQPATRPINLDLSDDTELAPGFDWQTCIDLVVPQTIRHRVTRIVGEDILGPVHMQANVEDPSMTVITIEGQTSANVKFQIGEAPPLYDKHWNIRLIKDVDNDRPATREVAGRIVITADSSQISVQFRAEINTFSGTWGRARKTSGGTIIWTGPFVNTVKAP